MMNWAYAKRLVLSCTHSSLKLVRIEEGQDEHQGRMVHFKCMCKLRELLAQKNFYHRTIFEARFHNSAEDGHYFGVTRSSVGRKFEADEYKAMVETVCREHFQMLSLDASPFN